MNSTSQLPIPSPPEDDSMVYCIAVTQYSGSDGSKVLKFVTGSLKRVVATVSKAMKVDGHKVAVDPFYNSINLNTKQMCVDNVRVLVSTVIDDTNSELLKTYNETCVVLKGKIAAHNKVKGNPKRSFMRERPAKPSKLSKKTIPIKCDKTSIIWFENEYISFDQVVEIVKKMCNMANCIS